MGNEIGEEKVESKTSDGESSRTNEMPQKVILRCYRFEKSFNEECHVIIQQEDLLNYQMIEEIRFFRINFFEKISSNSSKKKYFCVSIQRPEMKLQKITQFIPKKDDIVRFKQYFFEVCIVLRQIAKAIHHLHKLDIIHGDIGTHTCGKFNGKHWKLTNMIGCKFSGECLTQSKMSTSSPPEFVDFDFKTLSTDVACFKSNFVASKSVDIWAFGKLMYDVIVGEPFIPFSSKLQPRNDHNALGILGTWDDDESLTSVAYKLQSAFAFDNGCGITKSCIDLICNCLRTDPADRHKDMECVLKHEFWKNVRN